MEMFSLARRARLTSFPASAVFTRRCSKATNSKDASSTTSTDVKPTDDDDGPKPRMIYGQKYRPWRYAYGERQDIWKSKFSWVTYDTISPVMIKAWMNNPQPRKWWGIVKEAMIETDQGVNHERNALLGPDLAVAHFVVYRGGRIKFKDNDWVDEYEKDKKITLPQNFINNLILEEVDLENMAMGGIRYEGLDNFNELIGLRSISFKGNRYFDNWYLDKFCTIVRNTLECIDLRDTKVSYHGMVALSKLNYLNLIILGEDQMDQNMELTCAILESDKPGLLTKVVPKS